MVVATEVAGVEPGRAGPTSTWTEVPVRKARRPPATIRIEIAPRTTVCRRRARRRARPRTTSGARGRGCGACRSAARRDSRSVMRRLSEVDVWSGRRRRRGRGSAGAWSIVGSAEKLCETSARLARGRGDGADLDAQGVGDVAMGEIGDVGEDDDGALSLGQLTQRSSKVEVSVSGGVSRKAVRSVPSEEVSLLRGAAKSSPDDIGRRAPHPPCGRLEVADVAPTLVGASERLVERVRGQARIPAPGGEGWSHLGSK